MAGEFTADIAKIREQARAEIGRGPLTDSYGADLDRVLEVLNQVLATELVCVLRYKHHYYMAAGPHAEVAKGEFLQHANDEQQHADQVANRIVQLGGEPDFDPDGLSTRAHADYAPGQDLPDMIREDLVAERIAIASYQEIVRWLANDDPTSRRVLETLLEVEEEHADDLLDLLQYFEG